MKRFIRELRRREVIRTLGLYVGICWILIEVASVVLPTFDAPEWTLRVLIVAVVLGFPVTVVLAWIYDFSDAGLVKQADPTDTMIPPLGSRRMDFLVIGVLTVALVISVYMNVTSGPEVVEELEPLSVLIADFDNQTGNPMFDGALEQALNIGIEGASFITSYRRDRALSQAQQLELGDILDEETARLVAVRQDVRIVLAGSILQDNDRFELSLKAIDPTSGAVIADAAARAEGAAEVLMAINELAAEIRKELGEDSLDLDQLAAGEVVTATSLEAIKSYVIAQNLARASQDEEAIDAYRTATELDPNLARAYSGWGLSASKLGRDDEAEEKWNKALSLLDRMTDRERYRTLGLYYSIVSRNYGTAIENYENLVAKYPADSAAHNNLSVLYFLTSQFDKAVGESAQLLEIYPNRTLYRQNHALNAMWAGDMVAAAAAAETVIEQDESAFKPFLVLAMAALDVNDFEAATNAYGRMAETGTRGASLSNIGLADIALFQGRYADALKLLNAGIDSDSENEDQRGVASKTIALAQAQLAMDQRGDALATLQSLDPDTSADGVRFPAAEIYLALGDTDAAQVIATELGSQLRPQSRAYGKLIEAIVALKNGEAVSAIDALNEALEFSDLWIVRFYLGQAYLAAGYPVEASAEFDAALERRYEAMAMFFDDVPTWRYVALLPRWQEQARMSFNETVTN